MGRPSLLLTFAIAAFVVVGCSGGETPPDNLSMDKQLSGLQNGPAGGKGKMAQADTNGKSTPKPDASGKPAGTP